MKIKQKKNKLLKKKYIFYILIIIFLAFFFIKNTFDFETLKSYEFTKRNYLGIGLSILMLLIRDFGYTMRLKLLIGNKLNFLETAKIVLLWEFGSAISPAMIAGKAFAIYLLIDKKIKAAVASSAVILSILLDEIVFIIMYSSLLYVFGNEMYTISNDCQDWNLINHKIDFLKNIVYIKQVSFIILISLGIIVVFSFLCIFIYPKWIYNVIQKLFKIKFLNIWKDKINSFSNELIATNHFVTKNKESYYFFKLAFYTLLSWTGRYMVGVLIIWGFSENEHLPLFLIYAKQYVLWMMFYLPTTPGSSGIAESIFIAFYCMFLIKGTSSIVTFIWRFVSYYIYIIIGFFLLFFNKKKLF